MNTPLAARKILRWAIERAGYDLQRSCCWPDIACRLRQGTAPVVLDVGANTGQTAAVIKKHLPEATVFCFEPDPDTFNILRENISGLSKTTAVNLAAGGQNGAAVLRRQPDSRGSSLLAIAAPPQAPGASGAGSPEPQVPVRMVRLQDWCLQHAVPYIDVLKTDCQGFDLEVLKGAEALLRNRQVGWLCVEVLFTELYQGQAYFDDILNFLRLRGYSLFGIYAVCRDSHRAMAWADAVFMAPAPNLEPVPGKE